MKSNWSSVVWASVGLFLGALAGMVLAFEYWRPPPAGCVEQTRVVTESDKWVTCSHPEHILVETPIGYGRLRVSCSCPVKDAGCTGIERTGDEQRVLDEARDAGRLPPPSDEPGDVPMREAP